MTTRLDFSKNYQQMFRFDSLRLFHIDIFFRRYSELDAVQVCLGQRCMSVIPEESVKKTLREGVKLYSNEETFQEYMKGFRAYVDEILPFYHDRIEAQTKISRDDFKRFTELAPRMFYFASKTEFFYLDQAFIESEDKPEMRANMNEMYEMKEWYREHVMNAFFLGKGCYLNVLLQKLGAQFGRDWEDLLDWRMEEVEGLYDNKEVDPKIVEQRRQAIVAIGDSGKLSYLIGGNAAREATQVFKILDNQDTAQNEWRGTVANEGYAKGKVKVILSSVDTFDKLTEEFEEMNQGDILVAETTSPDLIPACKKAAAILTNQGGLLSHAAVVSRELGIPCIVDLKNVAQALKDGDEVEVDANVGTVRKLKT